MLRNNELIKYLNYQILKKNPQLLAYIKNKINAKAGIKNTIFGAVEQDDASEYLKSIEKAIAVLQEDP